MRFAYELTDEDKAAFLSLIREGHNAQSAADELDTTATQFRRLRNPIGEHFDAFFAEEYKKAITSDEHRAGFLERLREAVSGLAFGGNQRMLEKLSLIYDPDWEPLKHQNFQLRGEIIHRMLPYMSREEIDAAIEAEEAKAVTKPELKALPPAA